MTDIVSGFSEGSPDAAIASAMSQIINNLGSDAAENMIFSVAAVWKDDAGYHAQVMAVPKISPPEPGENDEDLTASSAQASNDEEGAQEADEEYILAHPYITAQTDLEIEQLEQGETLHMENADQPYLEEYEQPLYDKTEMQKAEEQGSLMQDQQQDQSVELELPKDDILEPKAPDDDAMTLTPDLEEASNEMEEEFEEAKNPANDQISKPEPIPATSPHPEPDGTVEKEDAS